MNKLFLLLGLCVFQSSLAGEKQIEAKIERLGVVTAQYGNAVLDVSLDVATHPCAMHAAIVSFDKTTEHGRQMYAMLLSAKMSNKTVLIMYDDTLCGLWGNQALMTRSYIY